MPRLVHASTISRSVMLLTQGCALDRLNLRAHSGHSLSEKTKENLKIMINKKFEKLQSNREGKSTRKENAEVLRDDELDAVTGGGGGGDQTQLPDLEGGHTTYKKV
jgi:hypothetical protein